MSARNDPERWRRLSELFERALDLPEAERAAILEDIDDPELGAELAAMLAADSSEGVLDRPLADLGDGPDDDAPAPEDAIGRRIGAWRLEEVLGRGGMGVVHAATRVDGFEQRAAIKRMRAGGMARLQIERFEQERQILAGLQHPHIARLLDGGIDEDGDPWFAMERVDGETVTDWADARRLSLRARIELLLPVCAAIQHSHERFVVHRDLKPENILVDADGNPKVLDFGIAKPTGPLQPGITRTGSTAAFTPEYATPEQISGGGITASTDVYALGLVLYRLLAGRMPYQADSADLAARVRAISQQPPMRLEQAITRDGPEQERLRLGQRDIDLNAFRRYVRSDLARILQTALAKEPGRRYPSVQAFAKDLRRFLDGRTVSVGGDTFAYRARKFIARNRWGVGMAALTALAVGAGFAGTAWQAQEAIKERDYARVLLDRELALHAFLATMFREAAEQSESGSEVLARDVLKLAAERLSASYTDDPGQKLAMLDSLGRLFVNLGDYQAARPLFLEYLAGADDLTSGYGLAGIRTHLANVEFQLGNYAEGRDAAEQAIAFFERQPEEYAVDLLRAKHRLALLARNQGDLDTAILNLEDAVRASIEVNGPEDERTASYLSSLGSSLAEQGRYAEAEDALEQAWTIVVSLQAQNRSIGLAVRNGLASVQHDLGRLDQATDLYREVISTLMGLYGPSLRVAIVRYNLASALEESGDFEGALAELDLAEPLALEFGGGATGRFFIGLSLQRISSLLGLGRLAEAKRVREDLEAAISGLGPQDVSVARARVLDFRIDLLSGLLPDPEQARRDLDAELAGIGPSTAGVRKRLSGMVLTPGS